MADLVGLDVRLPIAQRAGPAAHVERQVLIQAGSFAQVFQQVFQAARRPGEQAVADRVLAFIFHVYLHPAFGQGDLAFFVAVLRAGVTDEEQGAARRFQVNVVRADRQALALFDAGVQQQRHQGIVACIGRLGAAIFFGRFQHGLDFLGREHLREGADDRVLHHAFGRVHQDNAVLVQPAEEGFKRGDAPGKGLGAAGHAAAILHPLQEQVQLIGADLAQGAVGRQEFCQQQHIGGEGFDGVRRFALVIQVHAPGIHRRGKRGLGGDVSEGKSMVRGHRQSSLSKGVLRIGFACSLSLE